MRYLLAPLLLLFALPMQADQLTLWTENVAPGQTYGIELCQYKCSTNLLAELGPFTGDANLFFSAYNPAASQFISYIMNPNPDVWTFVYTLASGCIFGGHFDNYPIPAANIEGMFIHGSGGFVSYGVTGTNLVPEPSTWLLTLVAMLGVFMFRRLYGTV